MIFNLTVIRQACAKPELVGIGEERGSSNFGGCVVLPAKIKLLCEIELSSSSCLSVSGTVLPETQMCDRKCLIFVYGSNKTIEMESSKKSFKYEFIHLMNLSSISNYSY